MMTLILLLTLAQTPEKPLDLGPTVLTQPKVLDKYSCIGVYDSKKYKVELRVVHENDTYYMTWKEGKQPRGKGFGIRRGDGLATVYQNIVGQVAIINYTILAGELRGIWSFGDGQIFTEDCMPADSLQAMK